jgi:hypothetical protein
MFNPKLKYLFNKYIPDDDVKKNVEVEYEIVENDLELIYKTFQKAHSWEPDIMGVWNITYDLTKILETLEKWKVNPKDIFSDPDLPKEYRYFKFKEGQKHSLTESGKFKPINAEEQWHTVITPSKFYWLDAMSTHRYVRVGGKVVPGGYGLDNILKYELGEKLGKLKFKDEKSENLYGLEWHIYMVANRILEYIIYNQWDVYSMIKLDNKTKDIEIVLDMLIMTSNYDIFNSGPKKIVNEMHFFYYERGRVLGSKPAVVDNDKGLGLGWWINILPSHRTKDTGLNVTSGGRKLPNNIRFFASDADQVSGYPSDGQAANVSKDATMKELISVDNVLKEDFMKQNINLFFGIVNNIDYCSTMMNFPTIFELEEKVKKELAIA